MTSRVGSAVREAEKTLGSQSKELEAGKSAVKIDTSLIGATEIDRKNAAVCV